MTSRGQKLLKRMRNSKAGWHRTDLDHLYKAYGFLITHGRNHDIVKHPEFLQLRSTLPRHNEIAIAYVDIAIKMIDKLIKLQEMSDESERKGTATG